MALDHGLLNIPLSKRGNIDAQIDRYIADKDKTASAERKARAAEVADLRHRAKGLLVNVDAARVEYLAGRFGISQAQMRSKLKSDAHWLPAQVITLLTAKLGA